MTYLPTATTLRSICAGTLAVSAIAMASVSQAEANGSGAEALLKAMSDYLASQKSISFKYDTSLEVVTKEGQKLALASSGSVGLNRPDRIRVTRTGGFADVELLFDGKTVTIFGKNLNAYTQADVPGDVDNLVEQMREKFKRPLPGADLLSSDPYTAMMEGVTDVKDLGSGVIDGTECDHLAFRTEEVDWQIWIAQGDAPRPCRYIITNKTADAAPQYTVDVREWKAITELASVDFTFNPPADAKMVKPDDLPDIDEIPSHFRPKP